MPRTLDLTALRSFAAVADCGGVTRAAGLLNLTQSAVSMQLKRLEEGLGTELFDRSGRRLVLTQQGEQLLGFARRMVALNDEAVAQLAHGEEQTEIRLGVPSDIVHPAVPEALRRIAACFPRVRVLLVSSFTIPLKASFARGELDMILTTEDRPGSGGEVLAERDLIWVGGPDGTAARRKPLRLGFTETCVFRGLSVAALDRAGLPWEMAINGGSDSTIEAMSAADLVLTSRLADLLPPAVVPIDPRAGLPPLPRISICLYVAPTLRGEVVRVLVAALRQAMSDGGRLAAVAAR
ncbi:MAG: LysR family transcriptional regulator [Rhodobacteraceae bacterium]|jgi:DNA-binding transcriptional LysR family regulator|nr:LysR family transcriptional regulator [Paracoccaceae bacterium]